MMINYNEPAGVFTSKQSFPQHKGVQDFVMWTLPQIQMKNRDIQIVSLKNMTPSPFITCYLQDGSEVLFDVDGHSKEEIIERLNTTLGKSQEVLAAEAFSRQKLANPADFGMDCSKYCICSIPGQVPCPGLVPLPKSWRGKYAHGLSQDEEEE